MKREEPCACLPSLASLTSNCRREAPGAMPPLQGSSEQGLFFAPYGLALLVAQYAALFVAVASTHTDSVACLPASFPGAGYGWDAGVCITEEQVALCPLAPPRLPAHAENAPKK